MAVSLFGTLLHQDPYGVQETLCGLNGLRGVLPRYVHSCPIVADTTQFKKTPPLVSGWPRFHPYTQASYQESLSFHIPVELKTSVLELIHARRLGRNEPF